MAGGTLPGGGRFVAGAGAIQAGGNTLTINQATSRGIIDWHSFSIGADNLVQFNNGTGATLNRVTGGLMSRIDGILSATGSLYLINPQGIVIGPSGQVLTNGSFLASTRDIANSDFMDGGTLTADGASDGDVVNAGTITSQHGNAILVGRSVTNSGTLAAPNGSAALAAGNEILLQPVGGDPRIAVSGGTGDATNSGTLAAARAELSAAGGDVYALVENGRGINATGTATLDGHVWLTAGGAANVAGHVSAHNADGTGGSVSVRGGNINVTGTVDAAATQAGKAGGTISAIATGDATISGTLNAAGGDGGAGGFIETSGATLNIAGATVDAGAGGEWLLDPYDLTVDSSAASTIDTTLGAGTDVTLQTTATGTTGPGTANASGSGDIIINSPLSWGTAARLTLDAYHSILFNAGLTVSGAGGVILKTNDGGSGGDYVFNGSTIDFGGTDNGATLTINGAAYTLLYNMGQVQGINSGLSGDYALATDLDAATDSTTPASWAPIGTDGAGNVWNGSAFTASGTTGFSGTLAGLGHSISNLTVDIGSNIYAGLFGWSTGTLRDIGLIGGAVSGGSDVGGLAGFDNGNITDAYATGAVSGSGSGSEVGGLVGFDNGNITDAYATGAVSGYSGVGGLVGFNGYGNITDAYATGAVSGYSGVGGLAGFNDYGNITDAYATGAVSGSGSDVGGLVGDNGGTIGNGYWDTDTSGTTTGIGADINSQTVTGLTTAGLQGSLPTGFSNTIWGTGTGLYPYLLWRYPSTPQKITGTAYSDAGVTPLAGGDVTTLVDGASLGTVSSGANGYYYALAPAGTISGSGSAVLTYTATGAAVTAATTDVTGLDIYGGLLLAPTSATTLSTAPVISTLVSNAEGSDTTSKTLTDGLTDRGYIASGAGFNIDQTASGSLYVKTTASNADITVATAQTFAGSDGLTLDATGNILFDANVNVTGNGAVSLTTGGDYVFNGSSLGFGGIDNGATLTINGSPYTLLYNMGQVQGINSGLNGDYALATDLDASATTGWTPIGTDGAGNVLNSSNGFAGIFTGLGHSISNLTVDIGSNIFAGLFGVSTGTLRDIGLIGGSASGGTSVGGLAGGNYGTIEYAYATGAVSSAGNSVGGLVGENLGTVQYAYATGAVSGYDSVGGLVGDNGYGGTIGNAYASGAVSGYSGVGGLVGYNSGAITDAYATGAVSVSGYVGGLVGDNDSLGTISNGYWDTDTSGTGTGIGLDYNSQTVTGLTTAGLQGSLPTGFSSSVWGTGTGLYPYFKWRYPSTPQSITGTAYSDAGVTPLAGGSVTTLVDGIPLGTVSSGANGYYYALAPAGTISGSGSAVLAYTSNGAAVTSATTDVSGLDIWGNTLIAPTGATSYSGAIASTLQTQDAALITSVTGSDTAAQTLIAGLSSYGYIATGGSFDIDQAVSGPLYVKTTAGGADINVNNAVSWSSGTLTLNAQNNININNTLSWSSGSTPTLNAQNDININKPLSWSSGTLTLNAQNDINIKANLNGSGTAGLALQYGQSSSGGGSSDYYLSGGAKVSLPAGTSFSTQLGSGGATLNYYVITSLGSAGSLTTTDLQGMSGDLTGNYALGADIDATATSGWNSSAGFAPIGDAGTYFTGSFAGLGHTITSLTVYRLTTSYVGLFGYAVGGTLRDVGLVSSSIRGQSAVGALAGYDSGTVEYVYADGGSVTADQHLAGGLVGQSGNTFSISDSYATDNVTANNNGANSTGIGGLVGQLNAGASISNSYATGSVDTASTGQDVGGLVGQATGGTVSDSYATGTVNGATYVGGLAGSDGSGATVATYTNDYWDTTTSGLSTSYGGIGLTDTQMQTASSFSGWSIASSGGSSSTWRIYNGKSYPLLRNFLTPITVTASNASKTYDGLAYSGSNGISYSVTPNATLLGSVSYGGSAQGAVNAGSYAITPSGFYSTSNQGYDISYTDGSLTVNPAPLTVTANADSKTYDGLAYSGGNGVSYSGFVNGETSSVLGGTLAYGGTSQGAVNAGSYTITPSGLTSGNYAITFINGALAITAPLLTTLNASTAPLPSDGGYDWLSNTATTGASGHPGAGGTSPLGLHRAAIAAGGRNNGDLLFQAGLPGQISPFYPIVVCRHRQGVCK